MKVRLSYFCEQDGNAISIEQRIRQIMDQNIWPVILTKETDEELETCNNVQELKTALERRGIL